MNPYSIVEQFEDAVAEYTGAPYAVSVSSCTNAIFLCLQYRKWISTAPKEWKETIVIPKNTYVGAAMSVLNAGYKLDFGDIEWFGEYYIGHTNIMDSAKRFTSDMYLKGRDQCLSFHSKKILNIGRGGMILTSNKELVDYIKIARWDGRHPNCSLWSERFTIPGWNMYMTPEQAAKGLTLLDHLPNHNDDLPYEYYGDLEEQMKCLL